VHLFDSLNCDFVWLCIEAAIALFFCLEFGELIQRVIIEFKFNLIFLDSCTLGWLCANINSFNYSLLHIRSSICQYFKLDLIKMYWVKNLFETGAFVNYVTQKKKIFRHPSLQSYNLNFYLMLVWSVKNYLTGIDALSMT
jgi:hypothetical protein